MNGEFTNACAAYYQLEQQLATQEHHFQTLLANALPYTGQTNLTELDAIIACNRSVQQAQKDVEETTGKLRHVQSVILKMMQYFEIPPLTRLSGTIPHQLEFDIWADEQDTIHCQKTNDLDPEVENPNIITIKVCTDAWGA